MKEFTGIFKYQGKDIRFKITVYPAGSDNELILIHGNTGDIMYLSNRPIMKWNFMYNKMQAYFITSPESFDLSYEKYFGERVIKLINYYDNTGWEIK
ncbi:hypothetical protein ACTJIJ_19940 [Niabella sp. 22666]|uniref:hypothetical protein n=1 Tax=Niabella sp. 22666 TaxID=3453954 RepID=UPI003F845BAD